MKTLLISIISIFTGLGTTTFDNSIYVGDELVIEMLSIHFVMDLESNQLKSKVGEYLINHMDEVSHISGHFSPEGSFYYYAVYGTKDGIARAEYLEVSKEHFEANNYFDFSAPLGITQPCRKGWGHPATCPTTCGNWPAGCLGAICPPSECSGGAND